MPYKQQLLRIRRQPQISRRFPLRQALDPLHKLIHPSPTRHGQAAIVFDFRMRFLCCFLGLSLRAFDELVIIFKSGGGQETGNEGRQLREIAFVVDFATVGFGDEGADKVPGDFGGGDVGAALGDGFEPGVDNVGCAFVL